MKCGSMPIMDTITETEYLQNGMLFRFEICQGLSCEISKSLVGKKKLSVEKIGKLTATSKKKAQIVFSSPVIYAYITVHGMCLTS